MPDKRLEKTREAYRAPHNGNHLQATPDWFIRELAKRYESYLGYDPTRTITQMIKEARY